MSDDPQSGQALPPDAAPGAGSGATAGALLRAAREAQGLHIAALAAAIKVTPRKVEALESDRLAELPDATFARALAQTICRHLKIDAKPVLALLPAHGAVALEPASRIASTPYRERSGRSDQGAAPNSLGPLLWGAAVLLAGAAVLALAPPGWWNLGDNTAAAPAAPATVVVTPVAAPVQAVAVPAPAASAASAALAAPGDGAATPATATAPLPAALDAQPASGGTGPGTPAAEAPRDRLSSAETVFSAPPAAAGAAATVAGALVVNTTDASWVEVRDARGRILLSEIVQPGRTVGVDGALPLRLLVGNASATQIVFLGKPVDVLARSRENVARFELQ